jgi:hypothetical protein
MEQVKCDQAEVIDEHVSEFNTVSMRVTTVWSVVWEYTKKRTVLIKYIAHELVVLGWQEVGTRLQHTLVFLLFLCQNLITQLVISHFRWWWVTPSDMVLSYIL